MRHGLPDGDRTLVISGVADALDLSGTRKVDDLARCVGQPAVSSSTDTQVRLVRLLHGATRPRAPRRSPRPLPERVALACPTHQGGTSTGGLRRYPLSSRPKVSPLRFASRLPPMGQVLRCYPSPQMSPRQQTAAWPSMIKGCHSAQELPIRPLLWPAAPSHVGDAFCLVYVRQGRGNGPACQVCDPGGGGFTWY